MYTSPDHTRTGVGPLILALCERAAAAEGFTRLQLMATMSGHPLYRSYGFEDVEPVREVVDGVAVPCCAWKSRSGPRHDRAMASTSEPADEVLYQVEPSGVAWLVMNRPDAGNALTPYQRRHMIDRLEEAAFDPYVRVIVLTASGDRHFCTGGDLRAPRPPHEQVRHPDQPDRPIMTVMKGLESTLGAQRIIAALQDCPKPVIAAVNGTAAGMGVHVALACDLVIAADSAKFAEIFVRRGLLPDAGGAYLLPRLVGMQKAKELIFFGDDVPAGEALRIGLVNRVVPAAELRDQTRAWAERLAQGPTIALSMAKRLLNSSFETDRGSAFKAEALATEVTMQSVDGGEGVRSFVERRPPEFLGW